MYLLCLLVGGEKRAGPPGGIPGFVRFGRKRRSLSQGHFVRPGRSQFDSMDTASSDGDCKKMVDMLNSFFVKRYMSSVEDSKEGYKENTNNDKGM